MRSLLFIVFFLTTAFQLKAGVFDTLEHIEAAERVAWAKKLYQEQIRQLDSETAVKELTSLLKLSVKLKDQKLEVKALDYLGTYYVQNVPGGEFYGFFYWKRGIARTKLYKLDITQAAFTHALGYHLINIEKYQEGFKYLLLADRLMEEVGYHLIPDVSKCLYRLAQTYDKFSNHEKAIFYLKKALLYCPPDDDLLIWATYNQIGSVYYGYEQLDSALYYYEKALHFSEEKKDTTAFGILGANIARVHFKAGRIKKAKEMFLKAYEANLNFSNDYCRKCVWKILLELAAIALEEKEIIQAQEKLKEFVKFGNEEGFADPEAWSKYYRHMSEIHTLNAEYQLANTYLDSFVVLRDSLIAKKNVSILANLEIQLAAEKQLSEIALLEKENSKQRTIRNTTWVVSGMTIMLLGAAVYSLRMRQKRQKQKQKILVLEKQRAEEQTENYRHKLKQFIEGVREKNRLIEKLNVQVADFLSEGQVMHQEKVLGTDLKEQLSRAIILTEEDWLSFKRLFEQVYPGFIQILQSEYPDLTISEVRFLLLLKLNLSIQEMAGMLGISAKSVRQTRWRILKKLGIDNPREIPAMIKKLQDTQPSLN